MNFGWTAVDAASCATREDWLRRFLKANPTLGVVMVGFAYASAALHARLGPLSHGEIEAMQKELGVGEPPDVVAAQKAAALERREAYERRIAADVAMNSSQLAALGDRDLVSAVLSRAMARGRGIVDAVKDAVPLPVWNVWTAFYLDADVRNGGFDQYFRNSGGANVDDAIIAFRTMGTALHADIAARAVAFLRAQLPDGWTQQSRLPDLRAFNEEWFATYPRGRDSLTRNLVTAVLAPYVREHIDEV